MRNITKRISILVVALALVLVNVAYLPKASAGILSAPNIMLTNMNASGTGSVIIRFTTVTGTGTNLTVSFPTFTGGAAGSVNATQAVAQNYNGTSCTTITGASAFIPGTPTASGNAGTGLITFAGLTALAATTSYCAVLTSVTAVTNPTSTGVYAATITAGADTAQPGAIDIITNDQVVVNATVPASFTLALSANTDNFTGNLSTGSTAATTGITATVNTNALNGWFLWGSDANTGVKSSSLNYTIPSNTPGTNGTLTNGVEGYLTGLPAGGITQGSGAGVTSATTAFASSGAGNGSGLNTVPTKVASSTGTASGAIVTIREYATIAGTTPAAADYSDTITLVGAGSF